MAFHSFLPKTYYRALGSFDPILSVDNGDTIATTTVCAAGRDSTDTEATPPGNPMTGPFFVRGAKPGDTLAVHFESVRPNRPYGWSRTALAPNVLDPEFVALSGKSASSEFGRWFVDTDAGLARLVDPVDTAIGSFTVPIDAMVGCFGVAPPSPEAVSTATSGPHGGNMDYRRFTEGVTVYFPVSVPGALFFIGDGHARQGDGEINGTGIEISLDVQFRLSLVPGLTISWPWADTDDRICTIGNARPLDQALQHATTEMYRRLQQCYGMDPVAASIFMGHYACYEVGNVFDPAYTMVCTVPKSALPA